MNISEIAKKLKEYKEYKIVYHIRPDGDCICSSYALALALKSLGAKCDVIGQDAIPLVHRDKTDEVKLDEVTNPIYIAVDSGSPERTGVYKNINYTFCFDHHRDNSVQADYKYVEEDCGACSEIIFKLIKALGVDITVQIANFLYTALVTDTMCFKSSDTNRQTFEVAAELAGYGADICGIGMKHTFIKTPQRMKIEKILTESFNYTCDGKIVTGIITLEDLKNADILDSELEGINSVVQRIQGMQIGVTVRELPDGRSRCSTRTSGNIPANKICETHGGGGHTNAACCEIDAHPFEARKIMEETCKMFL